MVTACVLVTLWAAWALLNLALALGVLPSDMPHATGLRVHVPERLHWILTDEEFNAIKAHERGHLHHGHVWRNFRGACILRFPSPLRRFCDELEADRFAADEGRGAALAAALRKLSAHPHDLARAQRLDLLHEYLALSASSESGRPD